MNAISLAKLGIGFGALAVASIGLLSPAPVEAANPPDHTSGAPDEGVYAKHYIRPANWQPRHEFDTTPVITADMAGAPELVPVITADMAGTQSKVSDTPAIAPVTQTLVSITSDQDAIHAANDAEALALILALIDDL